MAKNENFIYFVEGIFHIFILMLPIFRGYTSTIAELKSMLNMYYIYYTLSVL